LLTASEILPIEKDIATNELNSTGM
jgi:hypothetical protein